MTVYNLYIFDREGTCLYYHEWNRRNQSGICKTEEYKLMYGMLFSIKSFCSRMSPIDQKDGFMNLRTNKFKLHFYETPSGLKFVLNTDLSVGNIRDTLHQIYSSIYLEYVMKNPLCVQGDVIESELFQTKLDDFVRGLPIFATKLS
ncbi:hypothetical protein CAPTEDRAFT_19288 [Capitella teleta]|uniref:Trafficking protein particle complex subunit n=1 Tax=Capitella teleta TaxID=283909 RepID=R7T5S0_CAPTE|nr:hypothetical protein CAPTEDRAFT_19288 [Capitella teleta]|eukprot:ELT88724.1 hypothetical protein CAPTEDRAFT_19288 [Capitella teleta]